VTCLVLLSVAGCTGASGGVHNPGLETLTVHLGLFGGPPRPSGGMALSNAPQPRAPILVTNGAKRTWNAKTNGHGIATFSVPPGLYMINSPSCISPCSAVKLPRWPRAIGQGEVQSVALLWGRLSVGPRHRRRSRALPRYLALIFRHPRIRDCLCAHVTHSRLNRSHLAEARRTECGQGLRISHARCCSTVPRSTQSLQ
jgi:hypothetical protein